MNWRFFSALLLRKHLRSTLQTFYDCGKDRPSRCLLLSFERLLFKAVGPAVQNAESQKLMLVGRAGDVSLRVFETADPSVARRTVA